MGAFVFMFFMACVFFTWFFIHNARTKERMLLIEKGIDYSNFPNSGNFSIKFRFPWLKIGIIITLISIGCLIGLIIEPFAPSNIHGAIPILFMFLFGGIGMILAHFIDKPKEEQ